MEPETKTAEGIKIDPNQRKLSWYSFHRIYNLVRDDSRRHKILFAAGLTTLGVVSTVAYLTYRNPYLPLDLATTLHLQRIQFNTFADLMIGISLPGYRPWAVAVVALGSLAVGYWRNWKTGLFLGGLVLFQGIVNSGLKNAIGRPRPTEDVVEILLPSTGHSFPSGHVMMYTVFFGFLFFLIWMHMRPSFWRTALLAIAGAFVLLVGPSRIYLGSHWFSDVVAAYLVAIVILLFGIEFYVKYFIRPGTR